MHRRMLLSLLVLLSALLPIGQIRFGQPTANAPMANINLGKVVFVESCAACHTPDEPLVPDFGLPAMHAIAEDLRQGHHHGAAPLSEAEFENLAAWLAGIEEEGRLSQSKRNHPE